MPKLLTSKPKKTAAQIKEAKNQTTRLLIIAGVYLDFWFVIKLESVLRVEQTVVNPVIECSDESTINGLIEKLFTVRANTYNVLGSAAFWGESWMKTQNIIAEKFGQPDTYKINSLPLPAKIFEWTVQDTAKNILAQQSAAKTAIISRIYKRFPLHQGENLTAEQKAKNQESQTNRDLAINALKSFETIKQIPWLHRYFREEYKRGHAKQNRQIVYQPQAYNCTRISRYLVRLEVQGLTRGKRISLIVKSNRIITGRIRLIRNASGSLEIHSFVTLYNRDYGKLINREKVKAVDRGYTEVFYTDDNQLLGKGFGQQLNKKTERITRSGRNKNKLWALAHVRYKENSQKSRSIRENNLGNQTELKRRQRDDAYVETVVNQACRSITFQAYTLGVESLVESIRSTKKLSKRAKNRLEKWEKGTVADRLTHWSARNRTHICWVSAAYTSQIDNRNGTLLGTRCRDQFFTFDGVVFHADHNAALNVRHRITDEVITQFMPYKQVQAVLLERTARFLNAKGLTLRDAVDLHWLDIKHTKCEAFQKLLHGL
ncbi:transposase [Scytonema sp. UIC 10036]|uniref:transposase n=1 Tax=Scytonema sp. UIC 10036 TaxID=2304196 RepID=UPI0012DAF192|nr:transposase [Scytonema sp. UIC 10036]MUG95007.1 transposase [Scytonema sp. UIC 10036]